MQRSHESFGYHKYRKCRMVTFWVKVPKGRALHAYILPRGDNTPFDKIPETQKMNFIQY